MVEEVAKHIYRIGVTLPNNPLKELNSYFIRGTDRDVLIDTGFRCEACYAALAAGLQELHSEPERRDVLLTHIHSDHSGMADLFVGLHRHICMSEVDLALKNRPGSRSDENRLQQFIAEGFPRERAAYVYSANPARRMALPQITEHFRPLRDGDEINVGDYILRAIAVPGHTPGNMMFWVEKQGIMFTGDHVLFDISPNITAWMELEDALGAYLESLERSKAYPVKLALPGHRKTGDYHRRIEALEAHHRDRLEETMDIVKAQPGQTAYEITSAMTWNIRARSWEEFPDVQKWFAVGEALAHLDYLRMRGRICKVMKGQTWRYYVC